MSDVLVAALAGAVGIGIGLLLDSRRTLAERRQLSSDLSAAREESSAVRAALAVEQNVRSEAQAAASQLRVELDAERTARVDAEMRASAAAEALRAEERAFNDAKASLQDAFRALSSQALRENSEAFLQLARTSLGATLAEAQGDIEQRREAIEKLVQPLGDALDRALSEVRELERTREHAYGSLERHLQTLGERSSELQREAGSLAAALRTPHVRGRWGELTLRRVVEAAGMSSYCDFEDQPEVGGSDGRQRPDLVVRLPGSRTVAVDSKVPLTAFGEAIEAQDEATRAAALGRHAAAVREHVRTLASKAYWAQFSPAPELVVLFLPAESFFSAAVEADRALLEDAIAARVMVATPTTLVALLLAIAFGWQQQHALENSTRIATAARELFDRMCKFGEHLVRVQEGLRRATQAFNAAAGSFETRVLPAGRRLRELGIVGINAEIPDLETIDVPDRNLGVATDRI